MQLYRPALGLKAVPGASPMPGRATTATQLLARLAQSTTIAGPLVYSLERVPPALGLRGPEQATGIVFPGGSRWASSFELSSAESAVTASRRVALLGQLHAPLAGNVGVSLGIRYSSLWAPGIAIGRADEPLNGYLPLPGRTDYSGSQLAYQLQLNYLYGERNTVALTFNSRREQDQVRLGSDPLLPEGSLLSVTGEHWFSPSWALRYDIPTSELGGQIRRPGLRLGVHYRF